jgi:hypothetical protein
MYKGINMLINTLKVSALSIALLASSSASAEIFTLFSNKTATKECGSQAIYVGPNSVGKHGGYCLTILGENINNLVNPVYTENKENDCPSPSGDNVYAGPAKSYEHGGICLQSKVSDVFFVSQYTENKAIDCPKPSGNMVYVGPHKEGVHGGSCIMIYRNK